MRGGDSVGEGVGKIGIGFERWENDGLDEQFAVEIEVGWFSLTSL